MAGTDEEDMDALIWAKQEELVKHLYAGRTVQLTAHGRPVGPPIEPRPTPVARDEEGVDAESAG